MRSVNKVVLMGHLATDPELKSTINGHTLAKFKLATNRDWISSNGEKHEATDYHKIIAWRKLGDICIDKLKKGSGIYLEGRLENHQYEDKQGIRKNFTEIVADTINFLSYKKDKNQTEEMNFIEVPV